MPAPLDELPLLVRAGAVLPLLPPDVDTLADYGGGSAWSASPTARPARPARLPARPHHDDARRRRPHRRRATAATAGCSASTAKRATTFRLQASLGTLKKPFRPCAVSFAGKPLARSAWSYRDSTRALTARFAGKKGRLVVSACRD